MESVCYRSIERYISICFPFKHGKFREVLSRKSIAVIYVVVVVVITPCFLEVRFEHGSCIFGIVIGGYAGKQLFYAYSLLWFISVYVLPVVAYAFLYGNVVLTLYRRKNSTNLNQSPVVHAAQAAITKTAITLTVICLIANGFDAWYYVLGHTGVLEFEAGGDIHMVAAFFSVVNSCVNPFIYLILIRPFRFMIVKTFSCCTENN